MTFILLGISFLVFYAIGMLAYKHDAYIIVKCNDSKPANDVYYHHLVPRGGFVPFKLYSDFLSNVAEKYPYLRFYVFFLIDDSIYPYPIPLRLSRLYPNSNFFEDFNNRDMKDFQKRHPNVNITVIPISKYMAQTPLKYKWRTIPTTFLPFYARIYSVWKNGGIGMDLDTFNKQFVSQQRINRRVSAIIKLHNDGAKPEIYADIFSADEHDDESTMEILCGMVQQILKDTRGFFLRGFPEKKNITVSAGFATSKEAVYNTSQDNHNVSKREILNNTYYDIDKTISSVHLAFDDNNTSNPSADTFGISLNWLNNTTATSLNISKTAAAPVVDDIKTSNADLVMKKSQNIDTVIKKSDDDIQMDTNDSEAPQIVFVYDISIISGGIAPIGIPETNFGPPPAPLPPSPLPRVVEPEMPARIKKSFEINHPPIPVAINGDGTFISATTQFHPFLGNMISAGCRRMRPKTAIQDTLIKQCSGLFKNVAYCNNIYLL